MKKSPKLINEVNVTVGAASLLQIARGCHRTHKNERLIIPKGNYLHAIYNDTARKIYLKKATQSGISEWMIASAIDRARKGKNVLYILPTFTLKNLFVQDRINKTIMYTALYKDYLDQNEEKLAESTSIKQFDRGTIAFTGSNTPSAFVSYPADSIYIDELDECAQEYLPMAEERQSASEDKTTIHVANPTHVNFGIDAEYKKTDMKKWFTRCTSCGEIIYADFFKHVMMQIDNGAWALRDREWTPDSDRDIYPICDKCGKPYNRYNRGEWVAQQKSKISGYHISKMFSTKVTLLEMVERFDEGLSNPTILQRFYNGDLGEAYTAKGAKIDEMMLDDCCGEYYAVDAHDGPCIAGIDVGSINNIVIAKLGEKIQVIHMSTIRDFDDLLDVMRRCHVKWFVIDSRPEARESAKICLKARAHGIIGCMCDYTTNKKDLQYSNKYNTLSIDRTMSLDSLKENIMTKQIVLPQNVRHIEGFYSQMTSSTRIYDEKQDYYKWVESEADHYMHAANYMLLAKRLAAIAK
jgi:hypothetical protein